MSTEVNSAEKKIQRHVDGFLRKHGIMGRIVLTAFRATSLFHEKGAIERATANLKAASIFIGKLKEVAREGFTQKCHLSLDELTEIARRSLSVRYLTNVLGGSNMIPSQIADRVAAGMTVYAYSIQNSSKWSTWHKMSVHLDEGANARARVLLELHGDDWIH